MSVETLAQSDRRIWLPLVQTSIQPSVAADDALILGQGSGTLRQAFNWLSARARGYTERDVARIVKAYARIGGEVGVDWFLAIAQLCHETGSLTSWWSERPRRNPAGIGVSGAERAGTRDAPPGEGWTWDGSKWRAGWSYPSWADHAVPAHLGLLLAYALRHERASAAQRALIEQTMGERAFKAGFRGIAPTYKGLNGRWAVPGPVYGQRIVVLAKQLRATPGS